ncbi:MAG: flagellar protein FlaG [Gammaproteobacteria bacterium]|nr:flagellar protein FlaG [Gammaproteobacteria bacterium]NNF66239.1 flagellar protein FlaG [Gammaproteobacteria bacterium]
MSSQVALVATEPVRASDERVRRTVDVANRPAGGPQKKEPTVPVVSTKPAVAETEKPEKLEVAVEKVRNTVTDLQRELQFSVDEDSGRTIITVIDRESGKIIRQIPPEELLQIADRVAAGGNINLIDSQA